MPVRTVYRVTAVDLPSLRKQLARTLGRHQRCRQADYDHNHESE
jgi:hypothetical protein